MRTLQRYIAGSFLSTFLIALLVLSFVMSVGLMFKATAYIAAGASAALVGRFLWSGFPGTLSLSIPIAALVSALLVFGRLSSDSEISAMRACGVRLVDLMRMPVLLAALLSMLCLHINGTIAPDSAYARRNVRHQVGAADLLAVIQPGRWIDDFPGVTFFVGSREGSTLRDLRILETLRSGALREIKAAEATITEGDDGKVRLDMLQVTVDPVQEDRPGVAHMDRATPVIADRADHQGAPRLAHRIKDRHSVDLLREVLTARHFVAEPRHEKTVIDLSQARTELSNRTVLALACLCFVALGVPLGIKTHRRESSIGIVLCLAVTTAFYLFLIAAESLSSFAHWNPHRIAWIPVLICLGLVGALVVRNP